MGWARTLLLGDIGNRLDIADAEREINRIQRSQQRAESALSEKEGDIAMLKDELSRQTLATQALTRFLIEKGVIEASELADLISQVDAEDGVVDGKMTIDVTTRGLQFQQAAIPPGAFRKTGGDQPIGGPAPSLVFCLAGTISPANLAANWRAVHAGDPLKTNSFKS